MQKGIRGGLMLAALPLAMNLAFAAPAEKSLRQCRLAE
jgi:hypothetical protein